jgi:hypothetical protein
MMAGTAALAEAATLGGMRTGRAPLAGLSLQDVLYGKTDAAGGGPGNEQHRRKQPACRC